MKDEIAPQCFVSSVYDPLDETEFKSEEMRAGIQTAENWRTYVTAHATTSQTVRQALEAVWPRSTKSRSL